MSERPMHPLGFPQVQGKCSACGYRSLFLASAGYVTCGYLPCPNPCAPSEDLGVEFPPGRGRGAVNPNGVGHHGSGGPDLRTVLSAPVGEQP